jgi:hypothetical protein
MNLPKLLADLSVTDYPTELDPRQNKGAETFAAGGSVPQTFILNFMNNILVYLFGIAAVLSLIYGGILYVTAGGDAEKAERGKRVIMYSVIAIVLMILTLAIYEFVIKGVQTGGV